MIKLSLFFVAFISGTLAWAQPPRCAAVFNSTTAIAPKIDEIISNLAGMKLNLDLALSHGSQNTHTRNLKNIYAAKVQELRENIGHHISDSQIRDMIISKIKSLQNRNDEAADDEHQGRQKTKEAFRLQGKMVDVDYFDSVSGDLHYVKAIDSVYSIGDNGNDTRNGVLSILNLKTEENKVVELKSYFAKTSDNGQIFFFTTSGQYKTYDIINDKLTDLGKLSQPLRGFDWLDVSPSHEWASIRSPDEIRFENMSSGQQGFTFKNPQRKRWYHAFSGKDYVYNKLTRSLFLNDSEALIFANFWHTGKEENVLFLFNFRTGLTTKIDTTGFDLKNNLTPNAETQTLYFTMDNRLAEIKYSDLGHFQDQVKLHDLGSGYIRYIKLTPKGDALYITTTHPREGIPVEFYAPLHNLPTNPDHFTRLNTNPIPVNGIPAFDVENHRVFISRVGYDEARDANVYFLEIKGLPYGH